MARLHSQRALGAVEHQKRHAKALKASKVRAFVLYNLRHTFLTLLSESGCNTWTSHGSRDIARLRSRPETSTPSTIQS